MDCRNFQPTFSAPCGGILTDGSMFFLFFLSSGTHCSTEDPSAVAHVSQVQAVKLTCKVEIDHGQVPLGDSTGRTQPSPTEADVQFPQLQPTNPPCVESRPREAWPVFWGPWCGNRVASEQTQALGELLTHTSPSWHIYHQSALFSLRLSF